VLVRRERECGFAFLLKQGPVLSLVRSDQTASGGPPGTAELPFPLGMELGEARPLLALPEAIDGAHLGASSRVLPATAVGAARRLPLAVLAVAGETTTADVEVLHALDFRAS
jgi:hypothetical protein